MDDQPTLFDSLRTPARRLAKNNDTGGSKAGAASVSMRSGTQKALLLEQYATRTEGLTDDEAANLAGLLVKPGCCWWHRCSDLRHDGLIVATGMRESALTKEQRMTCVITDTGKQLLERMGK